MSGAEEVVDVLLDNGADHNKKDFDGFTPLMRAAQFGNDLALMTLLKGNADPDVVSKTGATAIKLAESEGQGRIVSILEHLARAVHLGRDMTREPEPELAPEVQKPLLILMP